MTCACPEVPGLIHANASGHGDHSTCRRKTLAAIKAERRRVKKRQRPMVRPVGDGLLEDIEWLAETGESPERWPIRLGKSAEAIARYLYRQGRHDLVACIIPAVSEERRRRRRRAA